ncbi:MAG: hypothetical protein ACRD9L_19995, partial [Bryobacteraceae bacterium]
RRKFGREYGARGQEQRPNLHTEYDSISSVIAHNAAGRERFLPSASASRAVRSSASAHNEGTGEFANMH